jgi:glucose/mannose-6-phosphate isomerase
VTKLDDPALLALDRSGMLGHISSSGRELLAAYRSAAISLEAGRPAPSNVVIAGVGGSASAGDYFAALCGRISELPVQVVRGFSLPNYVSERTLVVVMSYSGNTEEALACYDDGWRRDAQLLVVTTGGRLAERAADDGVLVHRVTYDSPPRAALSHGLAPLLRLGELLGLCGEDEAGVEAAARHHEAVSAGMLPNVAEANNGAKALATALMGRMPLVLGAGHLSPAAVRFKNQLGENGKTLAAVDTLPEFGHNAVVGLATAGQMADRLAVVSLESPSLYEPVIRERFEGVVRLVERAGVPVHRLQMSGATVLEQLFEATAWGDFTSFYLGLAQGEDPTPIPQIEELKSALVP